MAVGVVERRVEYPIEVRPPERILVTSHSGLRHVPADAPRATLRATTTVAIRARLQKEKKDT